MNMAILVFAGLILLVFLIILAVVAVILIVQNRREDAGMRPIPPPQSYQSSQPGQDPIQSHEPLDSAPLQSPTSGSPQWLVEAQQLAQSGQLIQAIKFFREHTGLGLKEAKEAVEALAAGQPLTTPLYTRHTAQMTPEVSNQVIQLLRENRKIDAIKLIRETTNLGLKESKDIADGLENLLTGGMQSG